MKLYTEEQLLSPQIRKRIIQEIQGSNNIARKDEASKRHEVYKDQTVKWVMKKLQNEKLKPETLTLISNRASNISICKKIVNKLARAYSQGCSRETGNEDLNKRLEYLALLMNWDKMMKKADKYLRLQRNCMPWIMPELCSTVDGKQTWVLKTKVLGPWQYDAVENSKDPDDPIAIVLSDFHSFNSINRIYSGPNQVNAADADRVEMRTDIPISEGANISHVEPVARYIFWGNKYHFTCDKNGNIVGEESPPDLMNPIQEIPGVPLAKDRDEGFWASGGDDLTDGSILVNTLVTDMFAILFMQGWGQLVITGPAGSVPKEMEVGPHHAMILPYDAKKGEKAPTVTIVKSDPPIAGWMNAIEQYVALLLSTNNLAPSTVATKLDVHNVASGIALLIEKSESTEDIGESQEDFGKVERKMWRKAAKWYNAYGSKNALDVEFKAAGAISDNIDVSTKFRPSAQVVTEGERLDNMAKKKSLAIVEMLDLIMEENPNMTKEEALAKLAAIKKDRVDNAILIASAMLGGDGTQPPDKLDKSQNPEVGSG